ncbi:hypothetical protein BDQ17DRAFT_978730 [Cyathus striatus]|nr:hypothetical protein BDQ17DRAFT_978730 [Cyathus striatus]
MQCVYRYYDASVYSSPSSSSLPTLSTRLGAHAVTIITRYSSATLVYCPIYARLTKDVRSCMGDGYCVWGECTVGEDGVGCTHGVSDMILHLDGRKGREGTSVFTWFQNLTYRRKAEISLMSLPMHIRAPSVHRVKDYKSRKETGFDAISGTERARLFLSIP